MIGRQFGELLPYDVGIILVGDNPCVFNVANAREAFDGHLQQRLSGT